MANWVCRHQHAEGIEDLDENGKVIVVELDKENEEELVSYLLSWGQG